MSSLTDTLLNMPGPGGTLPIIESETTEPTPQATGPSSQIDPTLPVYGNPTTQSVRQNFATAQVEITGLMQNTVGAPFLPLSGAHMTGPMYLYNDPTDSMMPATKGYVDAGGAGGGGGMPEAPTDGKFYLRSQGAWVPGVALSGGTICQMTGELLLAGNPADALGAVPKQYADAIATTANAAVPLAGNAANPMTGLLILSGDPTAALGAVTKQYADAGLALKANAANPTFTGIATVGSNGRVIIQDPSNPALTLYNTTAGQPCYGVYNSGGYLGFGLTVPATGNPNGAPFATMDQSGNFNFAVKVNATGGRLISSSGTQAPSLTLNYTGLSHIFGLWAGSATNILNFGLMDANGNPQTMCMNMDGGGNLTMGNVLYFGGAAGNGAIQSSAGPNLSIGTGTTGNLGLIDFFANSTIFNGSVTVTGNISQTGSGSIYLPGNSTITGSATAINIGGATGNLTSMGLFTNLLTIAGGALQAGGAITAGSNVTANAGNFFGSGWAIQGSGGSCSIGTGSSGNLSQCVIYANTCFNVSGTWNALSDIRVKQDMAPYQTGLAAILHLEPISFRYNGRYGTTDDGITHYGLVADEVEKVMPEFVGEITLPIAEGDEPVEPIKTVDPGAITYALINAVKELDARLTAFEGKAR